MSETCDFYLSWEGCAAFGGGSITRLTEPNPLPAPDISGLSFWYDANNFPTITADSSGVISTWASLGDLSANLIPNLGSGITGVDSINGLNVVQFNTSNSMKLSGALTNEPKTAFVVFKALVDLSGLAFPYLNLFNGEFSTAFQFGAAYDGGLGGYIFTVCQNGIWCNYGVATNFTNTPTLTSCRIDTDISNNFITQNNTLLSGDLSYSASGFSTNPGAYSVGRSDGSSMDVGEIMIYNRALSDAEVTLVHQYLQLKWGIS